MIRAFLGASFGALPAPPALNGPLTSLAHYASSHLHLLLSCAWLGAWQGSRCAVPLVSYAASGGPIFPSYTLATSGPSPLRGAESLLPGRHHR